MIKRIIQKKNRFLVEYHIYDEQKHEVILPSEEVGEIVGYNENLLLCQNEGKYMVYNLQGEQKETFYRFVSPYPLKITIPIGQIKAYIKVEDEDEEESYRKVSMVLRSTQKETLEEVIAELFSQLKEAGISCPELTQYKALGENLSDFLQKYLMQNQSLKPQELKLCDLAFSLGYHYCFPNKKEFNHHFKF